jgi:hypothetical protein
MSEQMAEAAAPPPPAAGPAASAADAAALAALVDAVRSAKQAAARRLAPPPSLSFLLYGRPGAGKSTLAERLAAALGLVLVAPLACVERTLRQPEHPAHAEVLLLLSSLLSKMGANL